MKKITGLGAVGIFFCISVSAQNSLEVVTGAGNTSTNMIKITGTNKLASGEGLELFYSGGTGTIQAYDRTNAVFKTMAYNGLSHIFYGGAVGIGTASPTAKLHVSGSVLTEGYTRFYAASSNGGGSTGIIANPNGWSRIDPNGSRFIMTVTRNDVNAKRNILDIEPVDTWQHMMELRADGSAFFIGNVGIGTTTQPADYKLAVNGTIGARKVKVTLEAWPDFVFDSSYQLKPLYQVERFIQANKHLPEVPSATEVKNTGVDLGDNQALLLKKIEELTLYIIQQNKDIQQLKGEVEKLKAAK